MVEDHGPTTAEPGAGRGPGTVIAVLGPTGVGKTAVAVTLAARLGTRVVSCDSMQVYRGFPVLTNQPTAKEQGLARHEMVGVIEPSEVYSAGQYAADVAAFVDADVRDCGWALLVGGTGLYLRAALAPLAMAPSVNSQVRCHLEERAAREGPGALHRELLDLDPAAAYAIGFNNTRRLVRALGVILSTGQGWSGRDDLWHPAYRHRTLIIGLTLERADLYRRIDERSRSIVRGAAEEVRRHLQTKPPPAPDIGDKIQADGSAVSAPAGIESAIGYREIKRHVLGGQSFDDTVSQVATATRRYARRQLTWLRKLEDAVIIDVRDRSPREVADQIMQLALSGEHTKEPRLG
jgi:tRNA dimethylallyltransferase